MLEDFLRIMRPLVSTQDQTQFQVGSSGINFTSTGLAEKCLVQSSQPTLSCTVIVAHSGYKKLPPGIVVPSPSKNQALSNQILRGLINSPNSYSNDLLLFHSETGSATGKIMAEYLETVIPSMPKLLKLHLFDASNVNCSWEPLLTLHKHNVYERICPSYLTCVLAEPDDKFMHQFKNGTTTSKGTKVNVANFYAGITTHGIVKIRNGIYDTMDNVTMINIVHDDYFAVPDDTMNSSLSRCGTYNLKHMPRTFCGDLKFFVQLSLITKLSSLPLPIFRRPTLELAQDILNKKEIEVNAKKENWECPAQNCTLLFKTRKEQMAHTLNCDNWKK